VVALGLLLAWLMTGLASAGDVRDSDAAGAHLNAQWDPVHFSPAIAEARDEQCLACHGEILDRRPRTRSQVGLTAEDSLAWYQTLDTYEGAQDTFHRRHLATPMATQLMSLSCTFCHKGNDPREEAPLTEVAAEPPFTLRKVVDPSDTCLRCHGSFPWQNMEGLWADWPELRGDFEDEDIPNGCLMCHEMFRTVRHQVDYLYAEAIEEAAAESSDSCYGCHGGRAWYRIAYPYARHAWPDMPEEVPEWALDRPTR
jgi:hypothetical protein